MKINLLWPCTSPSCVETFHKISKLYTAQKMWEEIAKQTKYPLPGQMNGQTIYPLPAQMNGHTDKWKGGQD